MLHGPRIAEGNTAEVFAWGASHVLKLYRPGYPPNEAEREANLIQAVISAGVPTPAVLDLITVDGRPGIILERVEGPSMLEMLIGGNPAKSSANFPAMLAKLQADLHTFSSAEFPCLYARLQDRVADVALGNQTAALSPATVVKVQEHLSSLSTGTALCHGDFGPQNVLLTEDGPVIIDWVDAAQGHPAADVGRTVILLQYAVLPPTVNEVLHEQFEEFRQAFVGEYLEHHRKLTGVTWNEINRWMIPVAAARLNIERLSEQEKHKLSDATT